MINQREVIETNKISVVNNEYVFLRIFNSLITIKEVNQLKIVYSTNDNTGETTFEWNIL